MQEAMMTINCNHVYSNVKGHTFYNNIGRRFRIKNIIKERVHDAGRTGCEGNHDDHDHDHGSSGH
jgi:hypothetical protein